MQWWCSAQNTAWSWEWKAYPGVWLFIGLIAFGVWQWNRRAAHARGATPGPVHPLFVLGLIVLWLALDWPIGPLGAGHLASVHMLQFLLISLVAAPLLLRGIGPHAMATLVRPSVAASIVGRATAPVFALIALNAVVLLTHLPAIVDTLMATQLGSFVIDLAWLAAGLVFWWPLVVPVPARPRFPPPLRIGYVVLGLMFSPIMFGLAGFLVYSQTPLFRTYELAPPIIALPSQMDHQIAGVMMSVGGAVVAFVAISVIFFAWSRAEA
jgi:cytochrome c oxidase assembly factor CtaG